MYVCVRQFQQFEVDTVSGGELNRKCEQCGNSYATQTSLKKLIVSISYLEVYLLLEAFLQYVVIKH